MTRVYYKKLDTQIYIENLNLYLQENTYTSDGEIFIEHRVDWSILNYLEQYFVFKFDPSFINLTTVSFPGTPPHRDNFDSALNIYIDCDDEITTFYKESFGHKVLTHYDDKDLTSDVSFSTNSGDCYIIDTSHPHGVKINKTNSSRKILRLCYQNVSFEDLCNSISVRTIYDKSS